MRFYVSTTTNWQHVSVKEGEFFKDQGGLTQEWGKDWVPIEADGINHAREKAQLLFSQGVKPRSFLFATVKIPDGRV